MMKGSTVPKFPITRRLKVAIALGITSIVIMFSVLLFGSPDQEMKGMLVAYIAFIAIAQIGEFVYERALISYWHTAIAVGAPAALVLGLVMHYYWEATPIEIAVVVAGGLVVGITLGYFHPERKALDERYRQRKKMKEESKRAGSEKEYRNEAIKD